MVYQDHLTKFVHLRPLKTKSAAEVAKKLEEIFCQTNGAPHVLQSDNGREFFNHVINEVLESWPECRVVHGLPRHSQSQGSVERANDDVKCMITTYQRQKHLPANQWAGFLHHIQFAKNRAYHDGIKRSPCEAVYAQKAAVGLSSLNILLPGAVDGRAEVKKNWKIC